MKIITFSLLAVLALPASSQGLICIQEAGGGVAFEQSTKKWRGSVLQSDAKYVVSKTENPNAALEVRQLGSTTPVAYCKAGFTEKGILRCAGFWQEFYFNRKTMRFLYVYTAGYWNEDIATEFNPERKEGTDTPGVAIGTCTSL